MFNICPIANLIYHLCWQIGHWRYHHDMFHLLHVVSLTLINPLFTIVDAISYNHSTSFVLLFNLVIPPELDPIFCLVFSLNNITRAYITLSILIKEENKEQTLLKAEWFEARVVQKKKLRRSRLNIQKWQSSKDSEGNKEGKSQSPKRWRVERGR